MREWRIAETESCSDHRLITFQIGQKIQMSQEHNFQGTRYITSNESYKKFEDNIIKSIGEQFLQRTAYPDTRALDDELHTLLMEEIDTECTINKFHDALETACKKSFRTYTAKDKKLRKWSVPWWTSELTIMRNRTNAFRRRYQKTKNNDVLREIRKAEYLQKKK